MKLRPGSPHHAEAMRSVCAWRAIPIAVLLVMAPVLVIHAQNIESDEEPPETEFFFGESQDYDSEAAPDRFDPFSEYHDSSGISEERQEEGGWPTDNEVSPLFPELRVLDEVSAERSLEHLGLARSYYREAQAAVEMGKRKAEEEKDALSLENTRYEWERHDLRVAMERRVASIESKHRSDAITYLVQAMQSLNRIQNPTVLKSDAYLDTKANIYREYVKQQFHARNLHLCIDILVRYLELREEHELEPEPHRLLAACYRQQEVLAERSSNRQARLEYKALKNEHVLRYAELHYGEDSAEYDIIKRKVERDMVERPITREQESTLR